MTQEKTPIEKGMENIYSKEAEKEIKDTLLFAEEHSRIKVNEWRNFIDYDLIPLIKKFQQITAKAEREKHNKLADHFDENCIVCRTIINVKARMLIDKERDVLKEQISQLQKENEELKEWNKFYKSNNNELGLKLYGNESWEKGRDIATNNFKKELNQKLKEVK